MCGEIGEICLINLQPKLSHHQGVISSLALHAHAILQGLCTKPCGCAAAMQCMHVARLQAVRPWRAAQRCSCCRPHCWCHDRWRTYRVLHPGSAPAGRSSGRPSQAPVRWRSSLQGGLKTKASLSPALYPEPTLSLCGPGSSSSLLDPLHMDPSMQGWQRPSCRYVPSTQPQKFSETAPWIGIHFMSPWSMTDLLVVHLSIWVVFAPHWWQNVMPVSLAYPPKSHTVHSAEPG